MIKHYCDACGKEERSLYSLPLYVHVKSDNPFGGFVKIIDGKMHSCSGRQEVSELCIICYNEVTSDIWDKLKKIQKQNNIKEDDKNH